MAVDVIRSRPEQQVRSPALPLTSGIPARLVLVGLITVSFAVRFLAALPHRTPIYLPDEYIYSSLARSLAQTGRPLIRGELVSFPALLEPLLTAPFSLADPELAYRLTQGLHALTMSLAAVPAYLLGRRLQLDQRLSLLAAAAAVTSPALVYSSYVVADPIAYPLVLLAVYAGVRGLADGGRRWQGLFVLVSGLATFAKVQYVVLPVCYCLAGVVLERGRIRTLVSRQRLALSLFALPIIALAALGPTRALGYYSSVTKLELVPGVLAEALGAQALPLALAAGSALLPGAIVALLMGIREGSREVQAFALLVSLLGAMLLAQATLYAANGNIRFKERYLIALYPLIALAFGVYAKQRVQGKLAVGVLAAGLVALSARFPLSRYTGGDGKDDSPFLQGVVALQGSLGAAGASLVFAILVAGGATLAVAVSFGRRLAAGALLLTAASGIVVSVSTHSFDHGTSDRTYATYLPANARWIDAHGLEEVALLVTPGAPRGLGFEQLFWNTSLTSVLQMRGSEPVDAFERASATVDLDGTLRTASGRPVRGPVVIEEYAVAVTLSDAVELQRNLTASLWRPRGSTRLESLTIGRFFDGWLERRSRVTVWPDETGRVHGVLRIDLSFPAVAPPVTLNLTAPDYRRRVVVNPGSRRALRVPIDHLGRWSLDLTAPRPARLPDGRIVSVLAERPSFSRASTLESKGARADLQVVDAKGDRD